MDPTSFILKNLEEIDSCKYIYTKLCSIHDAHQSSIGKAFCNEQLGFKWCVIPILFEVLGLPIRSSWND